MGHTKGKRVFEHVQNVRIHIILHMHKIPLGLLLSIHSVVFSDYICGQGRP